MRILFYIEPVVFRGDPFFLEPHINTIRCFINANDSPAITYGLATSPLLCAAYDRWLRFGGRLDLHRFPLDARTILAPYGFDRHAYARDLYGEGSWRAEALVQALAVVRDRFDPDLVLSVSQNNHLRRAFPASRVVFFETGPLPRFDGTLNFYFDTGGLHEGSILEARLRRILDLPFPMETTVPALRAWREAITAGHQYAAALTEFRAWLAAVAPGRKVLLVATQPHDWVAMEGVYPATTSDVLIMRIAEALPPDWIAVPTFHRNASAKLPIDQFFEAEFPNIRLIPDRLRQFGSDPFLPAVDAIVTISSKTALTGALFGKAIVSVGQSMVSGFAGRDVAALDAAPVLSDEDCARMLGFIANRFSFTHAECFQAGGFLEGVFRAMCTADDPQEYQLGLEGWEAARLERIRPSGGG